MTEDELIQEYTKCVESPAYFYNNYCLVVDKLTGVATKPNPVTDSQIEIARYFYLWQRRLRNPFRVRQVSEDIKRLIEKYKELCA